jgi:hypothetical protein
VYNNQRKSAHVLKMKEQVSIKFYSLPADKNFLQRVGLLSVFMGCEMRNDYCGQKFEKLL